MSFIDQIFEEREFKQDMENLGKELEEMETEISSLKEKAEKLKEGNDPMAFSKGDQSVGELFDEAQKRMNTAKWAFGLTNKLKDPEDRKKHRRNFMIVMNKLRALINKLIKKLTVEDDGQSSEQNRPRQPQTQQQGQPVQGGQGRMGGMSSPSTLGGLRR